MKSKDNRKLIALVPVMGPNEASEKLGSDSRWFNFGRLIQHNPEIESYLRLKQNDTCPVCSCGLEGRVTVHHVSYLNRCIHADSVELPRPTAKRPGRTVKTPPCKGCSEISRCAGFLALVHSGCHVKIHALENQTASR